MRQPICGLCQRTGGSCTFPTKRKTPEFRRPPSKNNKKQKIDSDRLGTMIAAAHNCPSHTLTADNLHQSVFLTCSNLESSTGQPWISRHPSILMARGPPPPPLATPTRMLQLRLTLPPTPPTGIRQTTKPAADRPGEARSRGLLIDQKHQKPSIKLITTLTSRQSYQSNSSVFSLTKFNPGYHCFTNQGFWRASCQMPSQA
jgi:hypothetical protein